MEKYLTFSLKSLDFKDSLQFMNSSLDRLVKNLPKDELHCTGEIFEGARFNLMSRKGVYPYDYMDSFERFQEDMLPSKDEFYSKLYDAHISDDDYKHAKNVWREFELQNMGEYHNLYLKTDVLLLSDVFENFRRTCKKHYGLDPAHYFTSPGLSWDAILKKTKVELELISDVDMYQFAMPGK